MKKITIPFIFVLVFTTLMSDKANSQCSQDAVYYCATKNKAIYLGDFNTELIATTYPEEIWTVILNKDAHYRFRLCMPSEAFGDVVLTLCSTRNAENSKNYASTYNKATKKDNSYFDFYCNQTGIYYVYIGLKENSKEKKTCAVAVLSFVSDK